MKDDLSFIGENIRFLRRQKGWTISELADKAGISEVPLGRIERKENAPSAAAIYRLSKALGVSVELMFAESDQERLVRQAEETGESFICTLGKEQKKQLPQKIKTMASNLIQVFCSLEDICHAHKHARIPLAIPFSATKQGMEFLATSVRRYMGIENGVVFDYFELFENSGFRVIVVPMPINIESFSYYDRLNQNAFYFLNTRLNTERQLFKLVYEFGRVLILTHTLQNGMDPFLPNIRGENQEEDKKFTDHRASKRFAASFLMPESTVRESVSQIGVSPGNWSYELLLRIKHRFGVSAEAFLYRLDELGLITQDLKKQLKEKIEIYYQESGFSEPDSTRRVMTPNGRLWDLVVTAKTHKEDGDEVKRIEDTLVNWKIEKV